MNENNETKRENKIVLVVGDRGEGKTKLYIKLIRLYNKKGYAKNKIHIFMVQPNKWYTNQYNPGIEEICTVHYITDIREAEKMIKALHNGVIFFEDAQTIFGDRLERDIRSMLINTRMTNVDTFIIYHSWGMCPKDIFRLADGFNCFKIHEDPSVRGNFLTSQEIRAIREGQRGEIGEDGYYIER